MKGKITILVFVFSILSCSKSQLELTPKQEQEIASTVYEYNATSVNNEFDIISFLDLTIQEKSKEVLMQSIQDNVADSGCVLVVATQPRVKLSVITGL